MAAWIERIYREHECVCQGESHDDECPVGLAIDEYVLGWRSDRPIGDDE